MAAILLVVFLAYNGGYTLATHLRNGKNLAFLIYILLLGIFAYFIIKFAFLLREAVQIKY